MPEPLSSPPATILFVDDDEDVLKSAALLLGRRGFRLLGARTPAEAWSVLAAEAVDAILLDLNFSRGATSGDEGFRCLAEILAHDPQAVVVIVTGHSGINIAVSAIRAGASDFVMKPWSNERLVATITDAVALSRRRRQPPVGAAAEPPGDEGLILGESPAMQRVRDLIRRAAPTSASILIYGEAGTGKSLAARSIHKQSGRSQDAFITADLAGPADSLPSSLFGRDHGAEGSLSANGEASLFLDEVGALTPALQSRLLGSLEAYPNLRLIAATRRRREDLLGSGGLRDDLLSRLNTVEISLPPLRDRGADILLLAEHYLRLFARRYGRTQKPLSPEAARQITGNPWPGNVRALRQAMERAVILNEADSYGPADFAPAEPARSEAAAPADPDLNLARTERALVAAALKRNGFNVSHAARELGLTRAALYRRMAKHGL